MPAPYKLNQPHEPASKPPLPANWSSPWIDKSVEDCAHWLQQMPTYHGPEYYHDSSVDRTYFLTMDRYSKEDQTMLVCRVRKLKEGGLVVDYYPQAIHQVSMYMWTANVRFGENAEIYQNRRRRVGKPDRSRFLDGTPWDLLSDEDGAKLQNEETWD